MTHAGGQHNCKREHNGVACSTKPDGAGVCGAGRDRIRRRIHKTKTVWRVSTECVSGSNHWFARDPVSWLHQSVLSKTHDSVTSNKPTVLRSRKLQSNLRSLWNWYTMCAGFNLSLSTSCNVRGWLVWEQVNGLDRANLHEIGLSIDCQNRSERHVERLSFELSRDS